MKRLAPYLAAVAASGATWFCLKTFVTQASFNNIYDQKLQLACFTAFLTVGSFLLAMKAFILVRLREDVYKHESYRKRYLDQNCNKYRGNYYQGLLDLGNLLVVSVVSAFAASVAQVTLGFSSCYEVKLGAPALCVGVLVLVFIDWLFVYLNLRVWFEFIEEDVKLGLEVNSGEQAAPGARPKNRTT